ncbi:hypothetical protein MMC11_004281 [Xylographa trunciseda]|nr:hypothetical protein [Xylographa trunciseda]
MTFSDSIFINAMTITLLPLGILRAPFAWIWSSLHRLKLESALRLVEPVVRRRILDRQQESSVQPQVDAIEWTIELSNSVAKENTPRQIALQLLHNLWAGSAAPGGLVTQMIFIVLHEPKYLQPLLEEAETAIAKHGWSDKALNNMPLLDSYIRETNRVYPTGSVTCARTVMVKPFQFHDGLSIPVGSRVAIPGMAIQQDPDNFQNPLQFDGFRFARLSALDEEKSSRGMAHDDDHSWGAATISTTNLAFGYGKHACPGRFYAVRKAKLIFSKFLMEYDIKWANPVSTMPPRLSINAQFAPNQGQRICIRKKTL